jgi:hypothetical protein
MPVRTACSSCGKKLQIRDELVGKKVKCPACGTAFVAVAAAASAAVKADAPRPGPSAKDAVSAKPLAKKTLPPRDEDDDDDEDSEDRPARGKKSKQNANSKTLLIGIGAAVAVVVVGAGMYFLLFSGSTPVKTAAPAAAPTQKNDKKPSLPGGSVPLADLVPGDAWFFASMSTELQKAPIFEKMRKTLGSDGAMISFDMNSSKEFGIPEADLERTSVFAVATFAELKKDPANPAHFVSVVQTNKPFQPPVVAKAVTNGEMARIGKITTEFITDQTVLLGTAAAIKAYKAKEKVAATGVLEKAITAASESKGIVASLVVPPEMAAELPPSLGAFRKTKAIYLTLDLSERLLLSMSLTAGDATAARGIKKAADDEVAQVSSFLDLATKMPEMAGLVALGRSALGGLKLGARDKEVDLNFQMDAGKLEELAMGAIGKMRGAPTVAVAVETNNLKEIVLAWHNYHSTQKSFPPQSFRQGLSWRVAILPYMGQDDLYKKFKLDEPWNSASNLPLLPLMPDVYKSKADSKPGHTFYQTFVGPNTINKDSKQGMMMSKIIDGTTNTLVVAESTRAVEWTKPDDIEIAPNQPVVLGGADPASTLVAFADGSVRGLPRTLDQKILRWLIDPADGNAIPKLDSTPSVAKEPVKTQPDATAGTQNLQNGKFAGRKNAQNVNPNNPNPLNPKFPTPIPLMPGEVSKIAGQLNPYLGALIDMETNNALLLLPSGQAKLYAYPEFTALGTFKLGAGPAYRPVHDKANGRVFALSPNLKGKDQPGTAGGSQVIIYAIRDLLEGKLKKNSELAPSKTIELGGFCTHLCISPDAETLYALDTSNPKAIKVLRVSVAKGKVDGNVRMPEYTGNLTLARDGKTLYALSHLTPHSIKAPSLEGAILIIDPETMTLTNTVNIPIDPFAMEVTKEGIIFVSGFGGVRTDIAVITIGKRTPVMAMWRGVLPGSCLKLSEDQKFLYVSNWRGTPATVGSLAIPEMLAGSNLPRTNWVRSPYAAVRGEMLITPDNRFLLCDSGYVFLLQPADQAGGGQAGGGQVAPVGVP